MPTDSNQEELEILMCLIEYIKPLLKDVKISIHSRDYYDEFDRYFAAWYVPRLRWIGKNPLPRRVRLADCTYHYEHINIPEHLTLEKHAGRMVCGSIYFETSGCLISECNPILTSNEPSEDGWRYLADIKDPNSFPGIAKHIKTLCDSCSEPVI